MYRLSQIQKYYQTDLIYYCMVNLLNTESNPICHLLVLLGAHPVFHISRIRVKREKTCLLIDMTTPDDSNIDTEDTEKLSKCKDLEIDISRMWKLWT
jgi:hypothetical protein